MSNDRRGPSHSTRGLSLCARAAPAAAADRRSAQSQPRVGLPPSKRVSPVTHKPAQRAVSVRSGERAGQSLASALLKVKRHYRGNVNVERDVGHEQCPRVQSADDHCGRDKREIYGRPAAHACMLLQAWRWSGGVCERSSVPPLPRTTSSTVKTRVHTHSVATSAGCCCIPGSEEIK